MQKLDLEKAEEPQIKLPTSSGLQKKQDNSRKTYTSASLTTLKPLITWITTNCGKILKDTRITDHLTCLLRNLYAAQEALELDMEQWTGSKLGKEYVKAVYCHPIYLTSMQSISCEMTGWMHKAGIKIAGRNINKLRYANDTTLMAEIDDSERGE